MAENHMKDPTKYKSIIEEYYQGQEVSALVALHVEGSKGDEIAIALSKVENVKDVLLVTGDVDIMLKVSFDSTEELTDFILRKVNKLNGVMDTNTMMILTSYKEQGRVVIEHEEGKLEGVEGAEEDLDGEAANL